MIMKVTKLTIHNIGKIGDTTIQLDKPLILFYGEIRQGKTTILNAVRWVCGGEFPQDIISHGKDEAHIELEFDGGMISRSWYRTKDETKTTKSRPVVFIRGGKPVASPVAEIKRFLNPFLINQDHLREKSELERKQFFTELFAVDTSELDKEWFNNDREASNLRIAIKSYGEIDLTPVERVNDDALKAELQRVRDAHAAKRRQLEGQLATIGKAYDAELDRVEAANEAARLVNVGIDQKKQSLKSITEQIAALETRLANLKAEKEAVAKWLKETPEAKLLSRPAAPNTDDIKREILDSPDTSELEQRIQQAGATNVRAEQYEANKKRADEKKAASERSSGRNKPSSRRFRIHAASKTWHSMAPGTSSIRTPRRGCSQPARLCGSRLNSLRCIPMALGWSCWTGVNHLASPSLSLLTAPRLRTKRFWQPLLASGLPRCRQTSACSL
jgi:DNA repair exonuclease SbcCD ATPase subunit